MQRTQLFQISSRRERLPLANIVGQVALAIVKHLSKTYIRFPTVAESQENMAFWKTQVQIPGIVACIDGSHILILRPCHNGEGYFNRKHFYSLNVQGT